MEDTKSGCALRPTKGKILMRRRFISFAVVAMLLLAAAPAIAAKGGNGKGKPNGDSSSLSVVMVEDSDSDGKTSHSDRITFDVDTTATDRPHVRLECYQSGQLVLTTQTGYYDDYRWPWTQVMTLATDAWAGGPAECTATLYYFKGKRTMYPASLSFSVAG